MSLHSSPKYRGFTLIEMLVSLGIVGVVLSTILANQSKYSDGAALTSTVDNLAARIAEAQVYGTAVKERTPGTADFSSAYGVSLSILDTGSPTSYIVFIDRNANKIYDGDWTCQTGGTNECIEKVTFTNGNYIDSLCNIKTSGPVICNNVRRVDITFLRPDLKASMIFFNTGGQQYSPSNLVGEQFALKSPSGLYRYVSVYLSGQIGVYNTSL